MGRRKKEPKSVHREKIATAASTLFMEKGIAATSMDDIAKAAGYSKATLYVYFENKEEIVGILVLNSMKKLYDYKEVVIDAQYFSKRDIQTLHKKGVKVNTYLNVGSIEEFPFYFKMVLDKINIDFESHDYLVEEKETYQVGEEINEKIKEFIVSGIEKGDLRNNLEIMPTIFNFWGMLSGIMQTKKNISKKQWDYQKANF